MALLPISRIEKAVEPTRKLHAARSAVALAKQVLPALEKITKAAFYKVRLATPMFQRLAFLQWARAWAHGTSLKKCSAESAVLRGAAAGLASPPPVPPCFSPSPVSVPLFRVRARCSVDLECCCCGSLRSVLRAVL